MRRFIVCGSRTWEDEQAIRSFLQGLDPGHDIVITGGANGADDIAHRVAVELGLDTEVHPADWENQGKQAGFIRNTRMAHLGADACIAFWDGDSRGTKHMMETAERYGIRVIVFTP